MTTTWDSANKQNITLTNGNLTAQATNSATRGQCISTAGWTTGKIWAEFTIEALPAAADKFAVGISSAAPPFAGTYLGNSGTGNIALWDEDPNSEVYYLDALTDTIATAMQVGDVIGVGIESGLATFRLNNGTAVTEAINTAATRYFAFENNLDASARVRANFGATAFTYTPPSGYVGLDTPTFTGTGAATLGITASASGVHGVAGTAAATLGVSASGSGTHGVTGTAAATLTVAASGTGVSGGTSGAGAATLTMTASGAGKHGVAGIGSAVLSLSALGTGLFIPSITGTGSAALVIVASAAGSTTQDITAPPLASTDLTASAISAASGLTASALASSTLTAPPLP